MKIKKFGVAALLAIAVSAFTGTCFAIEESDLNIGGIYLGQPIKEVVAKMGKPVSKEKLKDIDFGYTTKLANKRYEYGFVKNGAKFSVIADKNVKGVTVNKTAEAAGLATKAGITLGSSDEDVLKAYGKPMWDAKDNLLDKSLSRILWYRKLINEDEEQLLFRFDFDLNGKLVHMNYIQRSIGE